MLTFICSAVSRFYQQDAPSILLLAESFKNATFQVLGKEKVSAKTVIHQKDNIFG